MSLTKYLNNMSKIVTFDEFINEELNINRVSDTECYLTRPYYYYNEEDDIVYGSDTKPIGDLATIENRKNDENLYLYCLDEENMKFETYIGDEEVSELFKEIGYNGDIYNKNDVQDFLDDNETYRCMLIKNGMLMATSIDIIEEN